MQRLGDDLYFSVIKIRREEVKGVDYDYFTGNSVKIIHKGKLIREVSLDELGTQSEFLYKEMITHGKGNIKHRNSKILRLFLLNMLISKLKAGSKEKADIYAEFIET